MSDEVRAQDSGDMEGLPRPAESPAEASDRFVTFMASVLIAVGWLGGAAVAAFAVYCAVIIQGGDVSALPEILVEWQPAFRDHALASALKVLVGGLLLALVPIFVLAGSGHILRVFVGVDRGVRRLMKAIGERP